MDVKSSRLKLFVILFFVIVVVGAGLNIRANHFASKNPEDCNAVPTQSSIEQSADAISPESIASGLACKDE